MGAGAGSDRAALPLAPVAGALLVQLRVDLAQVQLVLGDARGGRVALAGTVSVQGPAGRVEGPAASAAVVTALLSALGSTVTSAATGADGSLELAVGAHRVRVASDPEDSAWDVTLADGTLVVARPGGGVDVVVL